MWLAVTAIIAALILFRFSQYGWLFPTAVVAAAAVCATRAQRVRRAPPIEPGTISHRTPFCASSLKSGWRSIPAELAIVVSALTLAFWLKGTEQPSGWWRIVAFALIAWLIQAGLSESAARTGGPSVRAYILVFTMIGLGLISNMAPYHQGTEPLAQLMHHQGAYIGSALHIRAGLVPFYDFPLQYGLGPTLAIAAGCGLSDCWSATQLLTLPPPC